jgi:F0F1-type ATP synthase assembly protein I
MKGTRTMDTVKIIAEKLLTIKSLVTLALTIVFCYLSGTGAISGSEFLTVFATVIAFYFGTQHEKKVAKPENIES